MKKVCFVADRFFWEEEMGDLLYQEILMSVILLCASFQTHFFYQFTNRFSVTHAHLLPIASA